MYGTKVCGRSDVSTDVKGLRMNYSAASLLLTWSRCLGMCTSSRMYSTPASPRAPSVLEEADPVVPLVEPLRQQGSGSLHPYDKGMLACWCNCSSALQFTARADVSLESILATWDTSFYQLESTSYYQPFTARPEAY